MKNKTRNNKIVAVMFILLMTIGMLITKDATGFGFSILFGVPLFFAKENWIR